MTSSQLAIELQEISVHRRCTDDRLRRLRPVLSKLSATAHQGEVVALVGESGVGKTTLLRLIAGLEPLTTGSLIRRDDRLRTRAGSALPPPESRQVTYVAQDPLLFPHLSVYENISLSLKSLDRDQRERLVLDSLAFVELSGYEDRRPHQLSGGQQKRVSLARAIARLNSSAADLLLLDEPLSSLESTLSHRIIERLTLLCKARTCTVIWATHLIDLALIHSTRLWVIESGQKLYSDTPLELYSSPPSARVADLLGDMNWQPAGDLVSQSSAWDQLIKNHRSSSNEIEERLYIGFRPSLWSVLPYSTPNTVASVPKLSYLIKGQISSIHTTIEHHLVKVMLRSSSQQDLPNPPVIRMKLQRSFELKVHQEVDAYYLGEPLLHSLDEEPT